jgi:hypothetical protein
MLFQTSFDTLSQIPPFFSLSLKTPARRRKKNQKKRRVRKEAQPTRGSLEDHLLFGPPVAQLPLSPSTFVRQASERSHVLHLLDGTFEDVFLQSIKPPATLA